MSEVTPDAATLRTVQITPTLTVDIVCSCGNKIHSDLPLGFVDLFCNVCREHFSLDTVLHARWAGHTHDLGAVLRDSRYRIPGTKGPWSPFDNAPNLAD